MKYSKLGSLGLAAIILLVSGLFGQTYAGGRGQGFRPCPYSPYICPMKDTCKPGAISGKVVKVITENLEEGMHPGMAVMVHTTDQGDVHVHLGPVWFLERQDFELQPGDEVSAQGVCESAEGKHRLIAYELTKGDHTLHLRDAQGQPNWEAWRKR